MTCSWVCVRVQGAEVVAAFQLWRRVEGEVVRVVTSVRSDRKRKTRGCEGVGGALVTTDDPCN